MDIDDRNGEAHTPTAGSMSSRKRTAHACDSCRQKKSRCDGDRPCSACQSSNIDCEYGNIAPANTQSKSELILQTVLRVDGMLQSIRRDLDFRAISSRQPMPAPMDNHSNNSAVANATIPSTHISATENLLASSPAMKFPTLRERFTPIFQLEVTRPPIPFRPYSMRPFVRSSEVERTFTEFTRTWNFWYPVMSFRDLDLLASLAKSNVSEESCTACAMLLVMALGSASELLSKQLALGENYSWHACREDTLTDMYFDAAMKLLPTAYMDYSTLSTQCIFLAALYSLYLQRPLQAWTHLNAAATRCRAQLVYSRSGGGNEEPECIRRIFWSCYIIESDLIAELSLLPQSGIAEVESQVALPGPLKTHIDEVTNEHSALYFLACISMRRLLNRVHYLLYSDMRPGPTSPTSSDSYGDRFLRTVVELDHQLYAWRDSLPEYLRFTSESGPVENEHQGFLRQRFLTCKAVIYRSYVEQELEHEATLQPSREIHDACRKCLEASSLHITNLQNFPHTVLVDTWICSLSMTSTLFILLSAIRMRFLKPFVLPQIRGLGRHLFRLLTDWAEIVPQKSPSVAQSVDLIVEIDRLVFVELGEDP